MAAAQRDISVSEFFAKNRHLLDVDPHPSYARRCELPTSGVFGNGDAPEALFAGSERRVDGAASELQRGRVDEVTAQRGAEAELRSVQGAHANVVGVAGA